MLGAKQLVEVLDAVAAEAAKPQPRIARTTATWLRVHAPYAFRRLQSGRLLALNRADQPIGITPEARDVECECFDHLALPRDRLDLAACRTASAEAAYLYDDASAPYLSRDHLRAYVRRLAVVLRTRPCLEGGRAAA
jgi:hypothetical protein